MEIQAIGSEQSIYQAWEQAMELAGKRHRAILECLAIIDMEASRRSSEGRDELSLRAFTKRIRSELAA